ncbi:RnfABCDGE type electron transport complex subunit B [Candidatus Kinetoplastidibacterium crithidiae]|uniref:Electron transport complex protein RnfB n=1 Tax=Candidatus Kinetoplastidibacterium crithidiae TCC036E TaxID=1208918 RepID=M1M6R9_9PROT|nr:RnfABCDGE type electron transport complex subunit B [Candidatus Kinetoplastibacterium crithidii]AFZ82578.1 electron transport complex protein RnfB [Candidatus Kinetoplastibacterium crithidii (ex Angomonas deanei ATCC 30255)]AGF47760.1 electron transport complex protein RnfB [Candidatus Kinetoplastibacterium crithidii TCC036E]
MINKEKLLDIIDAILPQTQCGKCGYQACKPYAEALSNGDAKINLCPPGGDKVIYKLATILNQQIIPLDNSRGKYVGYKRAIIDENICIGCTICINKCPVDAIIGAAKKMHSIVQDWCTGCELCLDPCPVDCIEMVPSNKSWTQKDADNSRIRREKHQNRVKPKTSMDIHLTEIINNNNNFDIDNNSNSLKDKMSLINQITRKAKEKRNK